MTLIESSKLVNLQKELSKTHLKDLFKNDNERFSKYSLNFNGIFLDYSKNYLTESVLKALLEVAEKSNLESKRNAMFQGEKINITENRSVLHIALRKPKNESLIVDGVDVVKEVHQTLNKMAKLIDEITQGKWLGFSGKKITDIVNIGIGGSDLGPKMVVKALTPYHTGKFNCHFVSNVDGFSISEVLKKVNPETTLFIVASKSFSTQETLMNAITARKWLIEHAKDENAVASHFVAISSQPEKIKAFGINEANRFDMWDWVGGRYSLWSAIGLPIALMIGMDNFYELLKGANEMDEHFLNAPLEKNMPVILGLIELWYSNFWQAQSKALLAYDERLAYLADYLQQADMESNGKSCQLNGEPVKGTTGIALWGGVGTNGQHAFHQLFHQGTLLIPIDFIIAKKPHHHLKEHHQALIANCFAQSQALLIGKTKDQAYQELINEGLSENQAEKLALHKIIPGSRPSNTLILDELSPKILGSLIALYEHKIFTQGVIWNINSFDQWGVELGKQLGKPILETLTSEKQEASYDASTLGLIELIKNDSK